MCIKCYNYFTKCDHVFTTLTTCPEYHKQQQSAKGFFGWLFRRHLRKRKNCGKVMPQHLQNESYCQSCTVKKDGLRAQSLGQGALRVRKRDYQEVFRDEHKEAARLSLKKSSSSCCLRGKKSNHDIVHSQNSVWLSDLYHHPETLARKDAYAREAAPAPPVSSQSRSRSRRSGDRPQRTDTRRSPRTEKRRQGSSRNAGSGGEWMPVYGDSRPLPKPTRPEPTRPEPTHQYAVRRNSPYLPPAIGLPPRSREIPPRVSSLPNPGRLEIRRKTVRINNSAGTPYLDGIDTKAASRARHPHTAPPPRTITPPRAGSGTQPLKTAPERASVRTSAPTRGSVSHRPYWEEGSSQWEARKAAFARLVAKEKGKAKAKAADHHSDISFVCETSKAISPEAKSRPQPKRLTRRSRK
ncbi:hypothetical protein F5Y10DRAFT_118658 [Nemania abortiva]|nr:hypothetical protein F5Y10DRAFT_118658 [Nemania abortiva]